MVTGGNSQRAYGERTSSGGERPGGYATVETKDAGRDLGIRPRVVVRALGVERYSFCWFVKVGHSIWFQPSCILKHFWDVRNVSFGGTVSQTP